jgi:hypothetical protein
MRRARLRNITVVFHLHNFGYNDRRAFADGSAVLFPSEYSRRYHARTLGIDGPVIPDPTPLDRVVADNPEPKYVTFINPHPAKGLTVFARREHMLTTHLEHAGATSVRQCQGRAKVQIVREDHPVLRQRPGHVRGLSGQFSYRGPCACWAPHSVYWRVPARRD